MDEREQKQETGIFTDEQERASDRKHDNAIEDSAEHLQTPEKSGKPRKVIAGILITALVAANIYVNAPIIRSLVLDRTETAVTEAPETVSEKNATVQVKGAAETAASSETANTQTDASAAQTDASKTQETESHDAENWKNTIFGDSIGAVVSSLSVSGLTTAQKEKAGYRESNFIRSLAAFLADNGIAAKSVEFQEEVKVSSSNAYAFWATLDGNDDQILTVVMYPAYPGAYLFTLQDAQKKPVTLQTETQVQSESQAQVQTPPQTVQTEPVYNAAALSVMGIPSTLSNYLKNPTELQYTLYGWLWSNGKKSIASASVDSYSIDPDARTATISMTLSDGSKVTGTYTLDSNAYSYR